jgi:hypothetical protein
MFAFHKNYHRNRIQHGRKPLAVKHLLKINFLGNSYSYIWKYGVWTNGKSWKFLEIAQPLYKVKQMLTLH